MVIRTFRCKFVLATVRSCCITTRVDQRLQGTLKAQPPPFFTLELFLVLVVNDHSWYWLRGEALHYRSLYRSGQNSILTRVRSAYYLICRSAKCHPRLHASFYIQVCWYFVIKDDELLKVKDPPGPLHTCNPPPTLCPSLPGPVVSPPPHPLSQVRSSDPPHPTLCPCKRSLPLPFLIHIA